MSKLTVALIQLNSTADKEKNLETALILSKKAIQNGAQFLAFPETFNSRCHPDKSKAAESLAQSTSIQLFQNLAKEHGVWILAGSMCERVEGQGKVYNTSVVISNQGEQVAIYRKIHLFDVDVEGKKVRESDTFLPGSSPILTEIAGIKTGLSICYDLRFPKLFELYSLQGAQMNCVPSSFTSCTGKAHWEVLLRARAIENQCFMIAPNQTGIGTGNIPTYGNSMIVDPWGTVLARGSEFEEEIVMTTLDFDQLTELRKRCPTLTHKKLP